MTFYTPELEALAGFFSPTPLHASFFPVERENELTFLPALLDPSLILFQFFDHLTSFTLIRIIM